MNQATEQFQLTTELLVPPRLGLLEVRDTSKMNRACVSLESGNTSAITLDTRLWATSAQSEDHRTPGMKPTKLHPTSATIQHRKHSPCKDDHMDKLWVYAVTVL